MRRAARAVAVTVPALVVVAAAWLRLEQPLAPLWRVLALVALALAAALPRRRSLRVVGAVVATVAAARIAVGVDLVPWHLLDAGSGFGLADSFSVLGTRFGDGFSDFYGTHLPFDPRVHAAMDELVLAAVFTFSLFVALFAAARRPVGSALVLLVGAGWPATLLGPSHGLAMGAAILGSALVVLAGLGSRRVPALALPAAVVVATAAVAVGSATAARHGLVHWQSWNLANVAGGHAGVGFVWDAQYGGLDWPAHPTVVLEVEAAGTPSYLRAAVLDDFSGDAWQEGSPRPADSLEPAAALQPRNQTREIVTVEGLADTRLVGGSIPISFTVGGTRVGDSGFATAPSGLTPGYRYTAWSWSPRPTAAALRRSPAVYPGMLAEQGLLDVGDGIEMPSFGSRGRTARADDLVASEPALYQYLGLERLAEQVAGRARTPYGAVARLENWFVESGGFRYSNHPGVIAPPLVGFVTQTRRGYCQYFAGAMALMLRYLGIPSRVAVGFAGGRYSEKRHAWLVTDRDAHAWVEVWFKGFGWLPFDPTPAAPGSARDPLASLPTAGAAPSDRPPPPGVRSRPAAHRPPARARGGRGHLSRAPDRGVGAQLVTGAGGSGRRPGTVVLLVLLVAAAIVGGVAAAKAGLRFVRRRARDPREVAAACRAELAGFLADQRIEVDGSATLHELGDLLRREFGVEPRAFVAAATAARFGHADLADAAARDARRELPALLDSLRRGLTRRERLRGLLSLRSLGRSSGTVAASASLGSTGP